MLLEGTGGMIIDVVISDLETGGGVPGACLLRGQGA